MNPTLQDWKDMATGAAALSGWLDRVVASMTPNYGGLTYLVRSMPVLPGATYVDVPVELSAPAVDPEHVAGQALHDRLGCGGRRQS